MELKIDGQICDLKAGSIAVPGYDAARLADPEACREGRSLKIPIPATPRNDALIRGLPATRTPPAGSTTRSTRRSCRPKVRC